jgi:hypothetical protein
MKRRLGLRAALLKLAKMFEASVDGKIDFNPLRPRSNICRAAGSMLHLNMITRKTCESIIDLAHEEFVRKYMMRKHADHNPYLFPRDKEGAMQRAKLLRRWIKNIDRERARAKR